MRGLLIALAAAGACHAALPPSPRAGAAPTPGAPPPSAGVARGVDARAARWPAHPPAAPPNVLVLLIDDMGVDKQAIYGVSAHPAPTPNLDALAARSRVFRHAWATPGCTPTRAAALTGRYASRTGAGVPAPMNGPGWALPDAEQLIPEVLVGAPDRWSSAAIGKWHLADLASADAAGHARRQGFDVFTGTPGNPNADWPGTRGADGDLHGYYDHLLVDRDGRTRWSQTYLTTETADAALDILPDLAPPFFAWVAWNAVHVPLDPPPASLWSGSVGAPHSPERYDAVAGALDVEIGRLLRGIPPEVLAHTVVMVLGDNGTPEAAVRPPQRADRAKMTLYEGGVRVPWYVSGPGIAPGPTDALVHVVDLLPTVAAIAGAPLPADRIDGVSLLPVLADPAAQVREVVYTEFLAPNGPPPWNWHRRAARDARYKLIDDGVQERLYDLGGVAEEGAPLPLDALSVDAAAALSRLRAELARHPGGG